MRAIAELDPERARSLGGLLFDLDDTLLSHGALTRTAYGALWDLRDAGLRLVAVTGRPSGWGEVIARQWPVDGVVTENGAVHIVRDGAGVARRETCDDAERRRRRIRLAQLVEDVRAIVPEARLTDDVDARRSDVTWDIGERTRLPLERVDAIARAIVDAGARTTRSSVHLHATFDADDKASGAVAFLCASSAKTRVGRSRATRSPATAGTTPRASARSTRRSASPTCARTSGGSPCGRASSPGLRWAKASRRSRGRSSPPVDPPPSRR